MRRKLGALFVIFVIVLNLLLIRITYINAVSGEQYTKQALANSQSQYASSTLAYKRGDILDKNGTVLATSEKRYSVILDCKVTNSDDTYVEPTIKALVDCFGLDEGDMRNLLADVKTKDSQYQVVKKEVTIEDKKAYDTYKTSHSNIKGIWFEETYVRDYPLDSLASDVIGFTYDTDKADWGIESYYNNTLKGVDGRKYGYWGSDSVIEQTIVEPVDGDTIETTLDVNIQTIVEKYISQFNETYKAGPYSDTQGAENIGVVVMDPNDGSVLAMANNKQYNLNKPRDLTDYYSKSEIAAMSDEQKTTALEDIWRNYCISDSYEPGSVYKPVTVSAALEDGTLTGNETFDCDGYEIVSGTKIKCSKTDGHGEETLSDVIKNSCNDGLMQIGAALGVDEFCRYQTGFGFGSRTGIDLSGEASGIIGSADTMGAVDLATASFGQGFTVTMIQEASAIASIVNGGTYYRPRVVSKVLDSSGATVKTYDGTVMKQTVSQDVSTLVKSYMKASVDDGTSVYAKVDGYSMGGKTGTAQKIPRGNGKYLVSWIGFAPYDNPQVLIYVIVDEPNVESQADSRYAQWLARDMLQEILPYMNIYPDEASDDTNPYLAFDFDKPDGEAEADTSADTNVPEPQGTEKSSDTAGGNTLETDGYTNEEAGLNG
jgi:stage V sporulation protein D (sporulation-specific penicillin-binding protein)